MTSKRDDKKRRIPEEKSTIKTIPLRPITDPNRTKERIRQTPPSASTKTARTGRTSGTTSGTAANRTSSATKGTKERTDKNRESSHTHSTSKNTATTSSKQSKTIEYPKSSFTLKFESEPGMQRREGLLKSFMSGRPAGGSSKGDFKEFFDVFINGVGLNYKVYAYVYFAVIGKRGKPTVRISNACRLTVDTGSSLMWVTDKAYREAFKASDDKQPDPQVKGTFRMNYGLGDSSIKIHGNLHESTVSFDDKKTVSVQNQTFGIVEVSKLNSQTQGCLHHLKGGILGLGYLIWDGWINLDEGRKGPLPTLMDNLADKTIPEKILGITFNLPYEIKERSYDQIGMLSGALHFGGLKDRYYDKETMKEIPTLEENPPNGVYWVKLELFCENKTLTSGECIGTLDTGSHNTCLPLGAMSAYKNMINRNARKEVVKYDSTSRYYYLATKNFHHLRDLEFKFSISSDPKKPKASFTLPPTALVHPPALTSNFPKLEEGGTLFFALNDNPNKNDNNFFLLGAPWMMWHYIVLDDRKERKVGIAEIKDRKKHRWIGLP